MKRKQQALTYTVVEAAKILGLGRNACYDALRRGDLPAIRIGHRWLVPRVALERLLNGDPPTTPPRAA